MQTILERLAVEHPYYCADSNYYNQKVAGKWETMTEFLDDFENMDVDLNLVFRWDVCKNDDGSYFADVYIMLQRKGIFKPCHIESINEEEAARFKDYLQKHWRTVSELWMPFVAMA